MVALDFHMSRVVMKESELDFVKEEINKNLNLQKNLEEIKFTPLFSMEKQPKHFIINVMENLIV